MPHVRGSLYLKCTNTVVVRHELNMNSEQCHPESSCPLGKLISVELEWALKIFLTDP